MPLYKSASKDAFHKNVSAEVHAGKPVKQAVAIAYSVQRRALGDRVRAGAKKRKAKKTY
jgi:hypothetical protein